ncbi:MAG: hypothetical protein KGZ62_12310 [Sulfurimonas sp.]|nr:hypothetical protein [Sulfurimonas sp.]
MKYEKLIKIINKNFIPANEVSEAMAILIGLNIQQLKLEDMPRIEEFIVDLNKIQKTEEANQALTKIIDFIRK